MNNKQCTSEFLKTFRCVENPEHLYEANKALFGDYDEYIESIRKEYLVCNNHFNEL